MRFRIWYYSKYICAINSLVITLQKVLLSPRFELSGQLPSTADAWLSAPCWQSSSHSSWPQPHSQPIMPCFWWLYCHLNQMYIAVITRSGCSGLIHWQKRISAVYSEPWHTMNCHIWPVWEAEPTTIPSQTGNCRQGHGDWSKNACNQSRSVYSSSHQCELSR